MKQLGDILVEGGLSHRASWRPRSRSTSASAGRSGRVLVDQGVVTEGQLVAALATQIGMRFVDLSDTMVDHSAAALISGELARRSMMLPFAFDDGKLLVATADPANVIALDDVRMRTQLEIRPCLATPGDIAAAIDRTYRADTELDELQRGDRVRRRRRRTSPRSARPSTTRRSSGTSTP